MPSFEDLTGKKIGYLTILHRAPDWVQPSGQHKRMWHCLCVCGKECDVRASDVKSGNTTSCGCKSSRKKSVGLEDLTGKQYGDFIVVSRAPNKVTPSGQQTRVWHCKCVNCGLEHDIRASQLKHFSGRCSCNIIEKTKRKKKEYEKLERDLTDYKFGELTVKRFDKNINGRRYWFCICKCGKDNISVEEYRLLSGKKKSCGCQTKKQFDKKRIEKVLESNKNLKMVNPDLASEWHPTKNGHLTPMMVAPIANKKVWWLGECGHEYQMEVGNRTNRNCGCPYCSGKRILIGFNDFETWCRENDNSLLDEWDYTKNSILPSQVTKSSDKLIYWKCKKCSNVWKTKVDSRTRMKSGCPKCASYYRNAKPVINLDTNIVYESLLEAGKKLNINSACIGNVCRGKQKKRADIDGHTMKNKKGNGSEIKIISISFFIL